MRRSTRTTGRIRQRTTAWRKNGNARRLNLEQLENRIVLATFDFDFSENDGGFTTRGIIGAPPWRYTGSQWETTGNAGFSSPVNSLLISPEFTAEASTVVFSFEHEYNYFKDDARPFSNGGILEAAINGGPYSHVTPDTGYTPPDADGREGIRAFIFQPGYGASSGGPVTGQVTLEVSAGDTVALRWNSGWFGEEPVRFPDWIVRSVSVNTGGAAQAAASVADRNVFYNNSFFDVADVPATAADPADDNSLASDKTALLPGETATFANYTSYSLGINGIMVDIADLASEPTLETVGSFFEFKIGNDDTPEDWEAAAAPIELEVRAGAGVDGSDRVTLIWEDNAVQNGWLQTTVLANAATGLEEPDLFYFGNAIGDSGNSAGDASVNAQDIGGPRDNPHNFLDRALVDDGFDYNRDSLVNAQDIGIARDNPTNFLNDVNLISVPAVAPAAGGAVVKVTEVLPIPLENVATEEVVSFTVRETARKDRTLAITQLDSIQSARPADAADELTTRTEDSSPLFESESPDWSQVSLADDLVELLAADS